MTNHSLSTPRDPQMDIPVKCPECQGTGYYDRELSNYYHWLRSQ